ncbi:hypothetical protein ACHAXS_013840 [Conticribra weissflogii]
MHYEESSQARKWQLSSQYELNSLRERANRRARDVLSGESSSTRGGDPETENNRHGSSDPDGGDVTPPLPNNPQNPDGSIPCQVHGFASSRGERPKLLPPTTSDDATETSLETLSTPSLNPHYGPQLSSPARGSHPLLTPSEESLLLTFYCSKIPLLIGPHAALPRCRRDAKVAASASLLFRRFYLSNSVMMHDPKTMLVAAAFLASKVEDAMLDVRYLEMGTKEMNAHVPVNEILEAEVKLLKGVDFDLLMFHPYKMVLSYTEDLRTYLKSERGRGLVKYAGNAGGSNGGGGEEDGGVAVVAGEDLRPMHDGARRIVDDVIVSDIPLMYGPGEVGLAALMVANEESCAATSGDGGDGSNTGAPMAPEIDMIGYIRSRFLDSNESEVKVDVEMMNAVIARVTKLCQFLRELKEGKHGCGNHHVDMERLKGVHKKLKKCRAWGPIPAEKDGKKKKKKRKAEEATNADDEGAD